VTGLRGKLKLKKKILVEGELTFKVRGEEFNVKSKNPFLGRTERNSDRK